MGFAVADRRGGWLSACVRFRFRVSFILFAWFIATGGLWDVTQVVAWGRMFTGYVPAMSIRAAVEKTFIGEMCGLCEVVQKGKQDQERENAPAPENKSFVKLPVFGPLPVSEPMHVPALAPLVFASIDLWPVGKGRAAPPLPPPRLLA